MYCAQFQTLTDQQHVLYEEHVRNKSEYQAHIASMEKQLEAAKIQAEQHSILFRLHYQQVCCAWRINRPSTYFPTLLRSLDVLLPFPMCPFGLLPKCILDDIEIEAEEFSRSLGDGEEETIKVLGFGVQILALYLLIFCRGELLNSRAE
jgi:hypothetical protein